MALDVDALIQAHYFQFLDLAVSPDDQTALVVFGNRDMPHEIYTHDIMNRSIWRVRLSNGAPTQFAPPHEDAHGPCWAPDGQAFAYLSRHSGRTELWTMQHDGTERQQLTQIDSPAENPFADTTMRWSPDGSRIAYTVVPNGSRYALNQRQPAESITVHSPTIDQVRSTHWDAPPGDEGAVYLYDLRTRCNELLISSPGTQYRLQCWHPDGRQVVVMNRARELMELTVSTGERQTLYSGPCELVRFSEGKLLLARQTGSQIEVGIIEAGTFQQTHTIDVTGGRLQLEAWSHESTCLYGLLYDGVATHLVAIDLDTARIHAITPGERVAAPPRSLHHSDGVIFPFQGPSDPPELWRYQVGTEPKQVSGFYDTILQQTLPACGVMRYLSEEWTIETIVVYPCNYTPGARYPTLIYLHGGPEHHVTASFSELISARAESAAHYMASQGYVVFLPNVRGSSGYGAAFEDELGDYHIVEKPFRDLMTGLDRLIGQGIADPDRVGIYGSSYGGWLTAWAISQSNRFRGAVAALGMYDLLAQDRMGMQPFYALRANRLGNADPDARWNQPDLYRRLSPIEHLQAIRTPTLIIETGAERPSRQAFILYNGLCARGVETVLAYYPKAFHGGGWNDTYKRDYLARVGAWFNHCLLQEPLPDWFHQSIPDPDNEG